MTSGRLQKADMATDAVSRIWRVVVGRAGMTGTEVVAPHDHAWNAWFDAASRRTEYACAICPTTSMCLVAGPDARH